MKLNNIKEQFDNIGVGITGITYDKPEIIQGFHDEWELAYPLLRDVDGKHVDAWGIRNEQYGEGTFAFGIPHPGVVLISPQGEILAKWAQEGYRTRADWESVLEEVANVVGGE